MRRRTLLLATAAISAALLGPARADTTLNVATAGDQNMVDYINQYLGPKFEKKLWGDRGTRARCPLHSPDGAPDVTAE